MRCTVEFSVWHGGEVGATVLLSMTARDGPGENSENGRTWSIGEYVDN